MVAFREQPLILKSSWKILYKEKKFSKLIQKALLYLSFQLYPILQKWPKKIDTGISLLGVLLEKSGQTENARDIVPEKALISIIKMVVLIQPDRLKW